MRGNIGCVGGAAFKMVVIIGAGICGLATAYELSRRGVQAVVIERGEPFAEQSAGLARIFRIAHRRPELCTLAMRARAGWLRWQSAFGAGRLLGSEGFITVGPGEDVAAAMTDADAAFSWLDRPDIMARIPFVASPWDSGVFDPLGGSLRIRRALTFPITSSVCGIGSATMRLVRWGPSLAAPRPRRRKKAGGDSRRKSRPGRLRGKSPARRCGPRSSMRQPGLAG